jgi:hypothetical protein
MAAFSASPYLSLGEHPAAYQLGGEKALNPLVPGQMIIAHGTYEDKTETGPAAFLVLRGTGKHTYLLAPLGSLDPYWGDHLAKYPQVKARMMREVSETVPKDLELLRRWRVVSEPGKVPKKDDYTALGKHVADGVVQAWKFLSELVVSDISQPQAGNESSEAVIIGLP